MFFNRLSFIEEVFPLPPKPIFLSQGKPQAAGLTCINIIPIKWSWKKSGWRISLKVRSKNEEFYCLICLFIIANSPEKLSKFFGYDERIIHAFGSGYDDSFYYYQLKALPEDILPAPIMLTNWEIDGFKEQKWLETRENLAGYVLQTYPHLVAQEKLGELLDYLNEAYKKNYQARDAIMKYAVAKLVAKAKQYDFEMAEMRLTQQFNELANVANQLWSDIVEE
ncbi:hypothetical protein EDC44_11082 [Cricetibacter osteomyelitidis]|uniref:Uncharacterized protein n=1 Tax=Cricetibacter osteomyelitidis TaxID=1521931 RepID=A0A4R2T1M1_9PAST|nr:hypothetical protein EDC44_11082 [Cricetibacter osteomyelitidis]